MSVYLVNVLKVKLRRRTRGAPVFEVFTGPHDGKWRFRERTSGRLTSLGGEPYDGKYEAKRAAYAHAARVDGAVVKVIEPDDMDHIMGSERL